MRARHLTRVASAACAVALVTSAARAGTTAPLSSLATLPAPLALKLPAAPTPLPGLSLASKEMRGNVRWHELTAATGRGYCLASRDGGGARWMASSGSSSSSASEDLDLERVLERDGTMTLERTRVHFDPPSGTVTATARAQVELKEITRSAAGVVVWAYRDGRDVVVLTRNVEHGVMSGHVAEGGEGSLGFVSSDGCPFAAARLDARKPEAGTFAQLSGSLPAQGKGKSRITPRFIVDASVSRVARDPEPRLAVRVRMVD